MSGPSAEELASACAFLDSNGPASLAVRLSVRAPDDPLGWRDVWTGTLRGSVTKAARTLGWTPQPAPRLYTREEVERVAVAVRDAVSEAHLQCDRGEPFCAPPIDLPAMVAALLDAVKP